MTALSGFRRLIAFAAAAGALHRQRSHLRRLDDHLLSDIGLSRADALAEASRPAWDAPGHWQAAPAPACPARRAEPARIG